MTRDELFMEIAAKAKLLTPSQLEDCRKLRESSLVHSMAEIAAKAFLNPEQLRLINVAVLYEELRREDEAIGAFMIEEGFLSADKVKYCLATQEAPFREGLPFARLEELLIEKGYLTPQKLQTILQARQQASDAPADSESGPAAERPPRPLPAPLRSIEAGSTQETLKVSFHRTRIQGETCAAVLGLGGSLDGHTAMKFDDYLRSVLNAGFVHIVFDCEKLEYISSAGIGVIAGTIKRCRDGKGDLRLCSVAEKMRRVMQVIGLLSLVRTYENEKAAVGSFRNS
jgi:anti-sigma B factor antagonist